MCLTKRLPGRKRGLANRRTIRTAGIGIGDRDRGGGSQLLAILLDKLSSGVFCLFASPGNLSRVAGKERLLLRFARLSFTRRIAFPVLLRPGQARRHPTSHYI